jgi:hypothetical protein
MTNFIAYPKIEHLFDSDVVDGDAVVQDLSQLSALLDDATSIVIQEKVDGTNVSIHFEQQWQPICQKRSGVISQHGGGELEQFRVFQQFVNERLETLFELLGTEHCLFGEFLWTKHAVFYDRLPSYFVAFDVFNKSTQTWLSSEAIQRLLSNSPVAALHFVPLLKRIQIDEKRTSGRKANELNDLEQTVKSLGSTRTSSFASGSLAEGVVVRFESNERTLLRLKYRRKTFVCGATEPFRKTHMARNQLASRNDNANANDDDDDDKHK